MIRRVNWSITTKIQWVVNVADSHRNRSQLHRLSFIWPRKRQPRWAGIRVRPVVKAQDSANYVLIDLDAKSQSHLLGDSRIAPAGIPPFPLHNRRDEFLTRSLRSRATPNLRREQPAVLSLSQKIMEMP